MGIHGLTKLLNNKSNSMSEIASLVETASPEKQLHSCRLVVDGNSFIFNVHKLTLDSFYGGNYDSFVAEFEGVLDVFEQCKIKPLFIFDRAHDKSDRKSMTKLDRNKQKIAKLSLIQKVKTTKCIPNT